MLIFPRQSVPEAHFPARRTQPGPESKEPPDERNSQQSVTGRTGSEQCEASQNRPSAVGRPLVVSFGLIGAFFGSAFTTEFVARNNPEAARADALIAERLRGEDSVQETIVIRSDELTADEPAFATS